MTLIEFAKKLREDFNFKYLTVYPYYGEDDDEYVGDMVELWDKKPHFEKGSGVWLCYNEEGYSMEPKVYFLMKHLTFSADYNAAHMDPELMFDNRDFSPYADCIVEVDE